MMHATRRPLDAQRWHFQHGPIDLIIGADGQAASCQRAHDAAWTVFASLLDELVSELVALRSRLPADATCTNSPVTGEVAQRMWRACLPYREQFITPMAAVAGSVADTVIGCYARPGVRRAFVNNGGDIALHLTPGASYRIGVVADLSRPPVKDRAMGFDGTLEIAAATPVRGIATSGWRGRSFSLGIADGVTILARDAASADAAATIVANAVNISDSRIVRKPANALKDDSDLGDRLVTTFVPALAPDQIELALERGARVARRLCAARQIASAALFLQERTRIIGASLCAELAGELP
jgi:ApbE superfamily uncharacterized protein (UPF0280 family)